jgi:hypothetical protein
MANTWRLNLIMISLVTGLINIVWKVLQISGLIKALLNVSLLYKLNPFPTYMYVCAAGVNTHSLDFKKSAGGFIHGYRYTGTCARMLTTSLRYPSLVAPPPSPMPSPLWKVRVLSNCLFMCINYPSLAPAYNVHTCSYIIFLLFFVQLEHYTITWSGDTMVYPGHRSHCLSSMFSITWSRG